MAKETKVEETQGVETTPKKDEAQTQTKKEESANASSTSDVTKKFGKDNYFTEEEAKDLFNSDIFKGEGKNVSSKNGNLKFWEGLKGIPVNIIALSSSKEQGENGEYDMIYCTAVDTNAGEIFNLSVGLQVITSTILRHGFGAYTVTYKGSVKGVNNTYGDFEVILRRLLKN